jgi:hypothetical protein
MATYCLATDARLRVKSKRASSASTKSPLIQLERAAPNTTSVILFFFGTEFTALLVQTYEY